MPVLWQASNLYMIEMIFHISIQVIVINTEL